MNHRDAFLANGGDAGARTLAQDWRSHPLGPMQDWPAALRMSLGMVLGSSFPSFIAWGEELFVFHNDAYTPMLGNKAAAIGTPLPQLWSEVWDTMAPLARRVLDGEALFFENFQLTVERMGYPEQAWFTFSYSPLRDETGTVAGLLCTVVEVTDKVLALARHKEAEERYALCLEASGNIGTWAYELDTGATFVDEQFARLFQVDAALARAGTELARFTDMIHPDDRARVVAAIGHAIASDTLYDIEYRIPQLSREDVWVNARGKVFHDVATGRRRFAGVAVDITERKHAELARLESERIANEAMLRELENRRRLDVLLDSAPVGIVYADAGGRLLVVNATNRTIWGEHPNAENIDEYREWKGWWPLGTPHEGQRIAPEEWPISRVLRGEEASAAGIAEIEPFGAPGTRRTIMIRAAVIRNERNEIVGAVAANMDITAQVAAERALKDSEAKFRSIANVIPQMVWSAPGGGGNDYLNSRWTEFTGLGTEEFKGDGWKVLIHPDDLPAIQTAWERSLATGATYEVEHRLRHRSGHYRWVLNRALPLLDDNGKVVRWMGTLTDIHDKKRSEDELKAAARRKDEFLAMLAHELRNPLAPISSAAQLLGHVATDEGKVRQAGEIIGRQVRHLTGLVDDLLDVSRVTRGLVELQRERVDLKAVMASAVEQARPLIESRGHRLEQFLDAAPAWVDGDRIRLVQVIANLLNNAAKYTPQGGAIALSLEVAEGQAVLSVRDNGIGIGPELLPQVFELFTQAERTPDRAQGGLGLGLALVKSLVALHGGSVEAHSGGLGLGSLFRVNLPLDQAAHAPAPAANGRAPGGRLPARHIMIVDDNTDAAQSLAEILRALGNRVDVAHDPRHALHLAQQDWPEVFILDIGLPDIDGYALARQLHALAAQRPDRLPSLYLALTGYGQAHDKVLSKAAGFDRHFVKPVDLEALLEALG